VPERKQKKWQPPFFETSSPDYAQLKRKKRKLDEDETPGDEVGVQAGRRGVRD
jgi:hypothetical protein